MARRCRGNRGFYYMQAAADARHAAGGRERTTRPGVQGAPNQNESKMFAKAPKILSPGRRINAHRGAANPVL